MLSRRAEVILKSIVARYIAQAVPVPSQSLVNKAELAVSPATIRNEMAQLEKDGYIIRPHPSAGGIPSDKGYRFYVESLGEVRLPTDQQILISHLFHQVERELEEWLSLAATVAAQIARNVAIVGMPKPKNLRFKHLEVISLQGGLAVVIVLLHGARLRRQLVTFAPEMSQSELTMMANKLNALYSDLTRSEILAKKVELSPAQEQLYRCLIKIMEAEEERDLERTYLDGLHFTLNQPEFRQPQPLLNLIELVEDRRLLKTITPDKITSQGVQVIIGKENRAEAIKNCSVVISQYGLPDEAVGIIGVVGPTRMPYARTISAVSYLSSLLSHLVAELYGKKLVEASSYGY